MIQGQNNRESDAGLVRNAVGTQIRGFFAYLALTPAIFCFGLLLLITLIISLQGFQQQTAGVLEMLMASLKKLTDFFPYLEWLSADLSKAVNDSGAIEINNKNFHSVVFMLYGMVSFPFVILGLISDAVRGYRPPRPLAKKIKILALATLAVIAVLFANLLFGSGAWAGSVMVWLLMFTIGPGLVLLLSALSLSLHHLILTAAFESDG